MEFTRIVFKSGVPYRIQFEIDDNGCKTLISEERVKMLFETDPDNYIGAACRLCGQLWSLPRYYEDSINAEHGWECPNCRRKYESN